MALNKDAMDGSATEDIKHEEGERTVLGTAEVLNGVA